MSHMQNCLVPDSVIPIPRTAYPVPVPGTRTRDLIVDIPLIIHILEILSYRNVTR